MTEIDPALRALIDGLTTGDGDTPTHVTIPSFTTQTDYAAAIDTIRTEVEDQLDKATSATEAIHCRERMDKLTQLLTTLGQQ